MSELLQNQLEYVNRRPTYATRKALDRLGTKGPFAGESMECLLCGRTERSDPGRESNWRAIEIIGTRHYFCPGEFPDDGASKSEYAVAYARCVQAIIDARQAAEETLKRQLQRRGKPVQPR